MKFQGCLTTQEVNIVFSTQLGQRRFEDMARRKSDEIVAALKSKLEVLEVEAARLVVFAKANGESRILSDSASLVYETVLAMAEDVKKLGKIRAS